MKLCEIEERMQIQTKYCGIL